MFGIHTDGRKWRLMTAGSSGGARQGLVFALQLSDYLLEGRDLIGLFG
jgi:hypothetical protein